MLAAASLLLTGLVVGNAWLQRQQFYPSVVYITKSNPSMAVIYLQSLVLVILTGKLMRKVFFGQLRAAEFEHLMERSWYAVTETCLAFTVFKDDFSPKFVALFTLLLFLKSFHWLAEERVDYMERSPVIGLIFHLRVLSLALLLTSLDALFIQHAYTSTLTKGASVQLVFGFEYAILLTIVLNTIVKYVLHSIDLHSENPWENKAVFVLYTELVVTLVRVLLYVLFFVIMVRIYTLPLFAVRPMYLTMRAFKKAFNDVVLSRRAIHNMDTLYPDATAEELANTDNVCIICREEMAASATKKLPCNHIFHRNCLRSWFQRQQTCPTCRLDVLRAAPAPGPQAQPPQAVFHQQMAALRAQLEAMQQQRAGGAPPPAAAPAPAAAPVVPPNLLQMMLAAQQAQAQAAAAAQPAAAQPAAQPAAGQPAAPPAAAPAAAAAAAGQPTPAAAPAAEAPAAAAPRVAAPFPFPPFPFLPFTAPPPMPPPDFSGLSPAELAAMEGEERAAVEARIRCLRNIQVLLDAAVMEMQQYSSVIARNTAAVPQQQTATTAATAASTTTSAATTAATSTADTTSTATFAAVSTNITTAASTSTIAAALSTSTSPTVTTSVATSTPTSTPAPLLTPAETGARPKTSTAPTGVANNTETVEEETKTEEKDKNPFDSLAAPAARTAEQEEMRRKRLEVFEEQKRRLMNQ